MKTETNTIPNDPGGLLSPESRNVIADVRNYLDSVIVEVKIETDEEARGAAALGNELQKKRTAVEKQRRAEKSSWDEKGRAVQAEFLPLIQAIDGKKELLAHAILLYNTEKENLRIEAQAAEDAATAREQNDLEEQAATAREKASQLIAAAGQYEEMAGTAPQDERNPLLRKAARFRARAQEWLSKAEIKQHQAQNLVPIIVPQAARTTTGTRKNVDIEIVVVNLEDFIRWCLNTNQSSAYLYVNLSAVKAVQKNAGGKIQMPGLKITEVQKVAFSGR